MKLLPAEILSVLKSSSLPGTIFVEVDDFIAKNEHQHKIVLAIVRRGDKDHVPAWGNPTYVMVMKYVESDQKERWVINPWLSEELIERFVKLKTPARAMSHVPAEIIDQLLATAAPLDTAVVDVAAAIDKTVRSL